MAIFRCKMCGGDLEITEGQSVCTCEFCGTEQTLPRLDSDRKANLYDRANHFRRNNDFDKAMGIYEQILNEDNTDAEAYWSLVLCRYGIEYVEDPSTHKRIPTINRAQYTSIYADENYKAALEYAAIAQKIVYEQEAKTIDEIQKGKGMHGYKDTNALADNCQAEIERLKEEKRLEAESLEEEKRLEAESLEAARRKEAARQAKKKKIITAIGVVVTVSIIVVYMVVTKVVIPNNNYNNAVALMNSGKYEDAVNIFNALNGYKDSDSLKTTAEFAIIANASIGDNVVFGNYNGNTEWIVLAKEDGKILVISKYAIEHRSYNTEHASITWEKCTLRSKLNGTYLSSAFSSGEQARIVETSISNPDNSRYGTYGGNNTNDKVFLLSIDEVNKYFTSNGARKAVLSNGESAWWWLRSPGYSSIRAAVVRPDGSVYADGFTVHFENGGVRPALWIDTSNL